MKRLYISFLTIIGLSLTILSSCKKTDIKSFSIDQDGVYFVERNINNSLGRASVNFADSIRGDSVQEATVQIYLRLLGDSVPYDRKVYLSKVTIENLDSALMDNISFPNPFIFRKGLFQDTLTVTVKRPTNKQVSYGLGIQIDKATGKDALTQGVKERLVKAIEFKETYQKPGEWDSILKNFFGEYSVEKQAFMVAVLRTTSFKYEWSYNNTKMKAQANKCRDSLEIYNKNHPDNLKPFTFPQF